MLGNYDGATTLRYLIHHSEALSFELRGGHFLHDNAYQYDQNNMTSFVVSSLSICGRVREMSVARPSTAESFVNRRSVCHPLVVTKRVRTS
jgi:hypothetical protein